MPNARLNLMQGQVDRSRQKFVEALNVYTREGVSDSRLITGEFLLKLTDRKFGRHKIALEEINETIHLVDNFRETLSSFTWNVASLNIGLSQLINRVFIGAIKRHFETLASPLTGDSSLDKLIQFTKKADDAVGQLKEDIDAQADRLLAVAENVDRLQKLATRLIEMRTLTLGNFKLQQLGETWGKLWLRIAEEVGDSTLEKLTELEWEEVCKLLADLYGNAAPWIPYLKWFTPAQWERLSKVVGKKEINLSTGGTDAMQGLLEILRSENKLFRRLADMYQGVWTEIEPMLKAGIGTSTQPPQ